MAFRLPAIINRKQKLRRSSSRGSSSSNVPNGHVAVYAGGNHAKRFVIPISYINHSEFQSLLSKSEEEFGFEYPMGALTIPCKEDIFIDLITRLNGSS